MSSLERTLERGIDELSDDAYQRVRSGQADAFVWIERLDAALEYWLMRHRADNCGFMPSAELWDDTDGWQCSCLEDTDA